MKVHEYNEMMAYMLRPRQKFAIGGGVVEGEDLGSREGFDEPNLVSRDELGRFSASVVQDPDFQTQVADLVDQNFSTAEIADKLDSSASQIQRVRRMLGLQSTERLSFDDLNKASDGQFEKFFKEYLEKESAVEVAGKTRKSKSWPIIEKALKTVPKDASLKEKYNAIKKFAESPALYGYTGRAALEKFPRMGKILIAKINESFRKAEKQGFDKLNIKKLADAIPAYNYKTLQAIFGSAKKNPNLIKVVDQTTKNKKQNIINAKNFIKKLKELGVVVTQGEKKRGAYLFEPLTEEVKEKLKELKPLRTARPDYQFSKFRNLVTIFARASEDYNKFGFSKDALVLTRAADSLNSALIQEFTSKPLGLLKKGRSSVSFLDSAMSKNDVDKLKQFIEDTPQIKNVLSIAFDPTGKNGTYFKPRNLNKLSGGQLLRDILIQKDHIFPVKEVSMIEEPTRTTIGKFGPGGALLETPFNKVLTTGYFNNSLRNKIQNFLNSGQLINQKEAIKQIDNTLKGLNTTIYHNGNYYGGQITPSVERQIKKLGFDKFDIQEDVIKNIKEQDAAIKKLKDKKFSDSAIVKAVSKSKFAFPFVLGAGIFSSMTPSSVEAAEAGAATLKMPQGSPAQINSVDEEGFTNTEKLLAGTTAGAAVAARKPLLTTLAKVVRPLGFPSVAAGFAASQFVDINPFSEEFGSLKEDPNLGVAGADLLLPELTKQVGIRGLLKNPFFKGARAFTPIGLGLMGIEGIRMGMREQDRIDAMSPEEREDFIAEQESLLDFSA
jgi:2-oxo-4-hydroxy-4-carboxy--5-ureidoimidazoline (OHCU) decarboxylase